MQKKRCFTGSAVSLAYTRSHPRSKRLPVAYFHSCLLQERRVTTSENQVLAYRSSPSSRCYTRSAATALLHQPQGETRRAIVQEVQVRATSPPRLRPQDSSHRPWPTPAAPPSEISRRRGRCLGYYIYCGGGV